MLYNCKIFKIKSLGCKRFYDNLHLALRFYLIKLCHIFIYGEHSKILKKFTVAMAKLTTDWGQ